MKLFAVVFFLFVSYFSCFSINTKVGRVEWTEKGPVVYAIGLGSINPQMPLAVQKPAVIEVAKVVGLRNALEIIKGIHINSNTTIENRMLTDDIVVETTVGVLKEYEISEPKYYRDGTVELEVKVTLFDNRDFLEPFIQVEKANKKSKIKTGKRKSKPFSGLIIDCKDLRLIPALHIVVKSEKGDHLYSNKMTPIDSVFSMSGMVAYARTVEDALMNKKRIGENPYVISANKIVGENPTDVVISIKDIKKILSNKKNLVMLKECRVIFVSTYF